MMPPGQMPAKTPIVESAQEDAERIWAMMPGLKAGLYKQDSVAFIKDLLDTRDVASRNELLEDIADTKCEYCRKGSRIVDRTKTAWRHFDDYGLHDCEATEFLDMKRGVEEPKP